MKDIWEKFSIIVGIAFFVGSYYPFSGHVSPLTLILSIFGALLALNGIFEKGYYPDKFYYISIEAVIIYFGLIITYLYVFNPVFFLGNPNFYFYILIIALWINSFVFRYRRIRRYQKVLEQYNKDLKLNQQDSTAGNNKGTAVAELGEYKEAIECSLISL